MKGDENCALWTIVPGFEVDEGGVRIEVYEGG